MKFFTTAVLFLMAVTAFGQGQVRTMPNRVIRFEDARPANASERARFENAARAMAVPQQSQTGSHFAMVQTAGTVGDDVATGIMGIVHTTIPAGSLVGLQVRRVDGTTQIEGVTSWDNDLTPGGGLVVKNPGGALFFSSTKQYEMIVVDQNTLVTTTDYISVITGGGPFIRSPAVSFSAITGDAQLRIPLTTDASSVNAVVINGMVVPRSQLSTDPNGVLINLTQLAVCFGNGDISVTVTRGGQSDTTQFRMPQGMTQSCGELKG
jgi:hypothetical protein